MIQVRFYTHARTHALTLTLTLYEDIFVNLNSFAGDVSSLIILAEEEIVFIDLASEGWPTFQNSYLSSLHASAITCSTYVSKVDSEVFEKLKVCVTIYF